MTTVMGSLAEQELAAKALIRSSTYCSMVHLVRRTTHQLSPHLEVHGLNPLSFLVLGELYAHPGVTPSQLARVCALTPQHLAGVMDRLEAEALLQRTGQRGRGRRTSLTVTQLGIRRLGDCWPEVMRVGSAQNLQLSPAEDGLLLSLLNRALDARPPAAEDMVVLVDDEGTVTGTAPRPLVHGDRTPLHLAFSSYLFDERGRVLLTRRSLAKSTWPGVWTNSSCGHLRPGETALQAAARRVPEELGVRPSRLRVVLPDFRYQAVDAAGVMEHELCPVLVGRVAAAELSPDPLEVAEFSWVDPEDLVRLSASTPQLLSPWCVAQTAALVGTDWLDQDHTAEA